MFGISTTARWLAVLSVAITANASSEGWIGGLVKRGLVMEKDTEHIKRTLDQSRRTMTQDGEAMAYFAAESYAAPLSRKDAPGPTEVGVENPNIGYHHIPAHVIQREWTTDTSLLEPHAFGVWEKRAGVGSTRSIVLAFRGTSPSGDDWKALEADVLIMAGEEEKSAYHRQAFNTLQAIVRWASGQDPYTITLCGHSLGGSLALWVAERLAVSDLPQSRGTTWPQRTFPHHAGTYVYCPASSALRGSRRVIDTYGTVNPLNHYHFVEYDGLSFSLMSAFRDEEQFSRVVVLPGQRPDICDRIPFVGGTRTPDADATLDMTVNHSMTNFLASPGYAEDLEKRQEASKRDLSESAHRLTTGAYQLMGAIQGDAPLGQRIQEGTGAASHVIYPVANHVYPLVTNHVCPLVAKLLRSLINACECHRRAATEATGPHSASDVQTNARCCRRRVARLHQE